MIMIIIIVFLAYRPHKAFVRLKRSVNVNATQHQCPQDEEQPLLGSIAQVRAGAMQRRAFAGLLITHF